jgi:hypothetical protein
MANRQAQDYINKGYRPGSIVRVKMVSYSHFTFEGLINHDFTLYVRLLG